ncbi:MAG: DinB family protein [Chloroflexota bacterium]
MAERNEIEAVVHRLESAPGRFAALLSSLEDADSIEQSADDGSTPQGVFAHLRAANAILEPRIYFVLVRDNPPLVGYDDARWMEIARYASLPVTDSLETMRLYRSELVYMLRGISLDDWDRTGTHEVRGPMTVLELAQQIAEQDDDHLGQIQKSIGVWFER